jgi:hypothetical protein
LAIGSSELRRSAALHLWNDRTAQLLVVEDDETIGG